MAYSKAQNRATLKYQKKKYDSFPLRFSKGEREKYLKHAEAKGKSLNSLILELLNKDMEG